MIELKEELKLTVWKELSARGERSLRGSEKVRAANQAGATKRSEKQNHAAVTAQNFIASALVVNAR